jgi:hypothetical protein
MQGVYRVVVVGLQAVFAAPTIANSRESFSKLPSIVLFLEEKKKDCGECC